MKAKTVVKPAVTKAAKSTAKSTAKEKKPVTIAENKAWYRNESFARAQLWNLRGADVKIDAKGEIKAGSIIKGRYGFALAVVSVAGHAATVVPFKASMTIEQGGVKFPAMGDSDLNYCVAAAKCGGKVILFNREIEKGASYRRDASRAAFVSASPCAVPTVAKLPAK